jgi:hypothetical protein
MHGKLINFQKKQMLPNVKNIGTCQHTADTERWLNRAELKRSVRVGLGDSPTSSNLYGCVQVALLAISTNGDYDGLRFCGFCLRVLFTVNVSESARRVVFSVSVCSLPCIFYQRGRRCSTKSFTCQMSVQRL